MKKRNPTKELNVFVQYFISGKSHKEIAKKIGVCKKRVVFLKKKAIKKIKVGLFEAPYRLLKERRRKLLMVEVFKKQAAKVKKQQDQNQL